MGSSGEDEGPASTFDCHECGSCCTGLRDRGPRPASFAAIAGAGVYRLPTEGGLRLFAWEAGPFPEDRLRPTLVVADAREDVLVALAYELEADTCPQYDVDDRSCTIYEDRPLVCRAYPLILSQSDGGDLTLAISAACGARVPADQLASKGKRETRLAKAYPQELAPALAVPALIDRLVAWVRFLETANVLAPVRGLEEHEIRGFGSKAPVCLVERLAGEDALDGEEIEQRAAQVVASISERWARTPQ